MVNWRRRSNLIRGISVDGGWIGEPLRVKEEVKLFFQNRFQESMGSRPNLDGVEFRSI